MRWTLLLVLVFMTLSLTAQRFSAAAVVGLNASQIDGDALAGFDRLGISAGLKGSAIIGDRLDLHVEFLYSQRGSRPDIFSSGFDPDINIKLQYLELPVYISYGDWYDEDGDYYKVSAHGGLSFGRLIEAQTFDHHNPSEENLDNFVDEFNQNDISFLLGFGFRPSARWGMTFRYTRSINLLVNAKKKQLPIPSLRPYFLSFRAEYIF